ncbi:MAG: hypothetical protein LBB26_02860 [Puniceicoccales bacterium]|nr:hypothetical protein [Puniceicoccales bacterium]
MYFSVLDEDEGSVTHRMSYTTEVPVSTYSGATIYGGAHPVNAYGTSTTYIPETHYYNTTTYYKSYVFVLINADELNRWKNYYKVLDYYQPKTP